MFSMILKLPPPVFRVAPMTATDLGAKKLSIEVISEP
jgi:hypothetical protein